MMGGELLLFDQRGLSQAFHHWGGQELFYRGT